MQKQIEPVHEILVLKAYGSSKAKSRPLVKSAYQKKNSYFSTETYVVGTQKNSLNEMVLFSAQNIC